MNETLSLVQQRERRTARDVVAVEFATNFVTRYGEEFAAGPFEVSAGHYGVVVYSATLRTEADFEAMQEALIRAKAAYLGMAGGWGGNG